MLFFVLFLVVILTFIYRSVIDVDNGSFVTDSATHTFYMNYFAKKKFKVQPVEDGKFLLGSISAYPILFHLILSKIKDAIKIEEYDRLFSAILESLFNGCLFIGTYKFLYEYCQTEYLLLVSFIVSLLYIFTPLFYFITGRLYNFGTRAISYYLCIITLFIAVLDLNSDYWGILLCLVFLICVNILASQFNTQVLILFFTFYSIYSFDFRLLLALFWGVVLAYLSSPKWFLLFIRNKYQHLKLHYRQFVIDKNTTAIHFYKTYYRKNIVVMLLPFFAVFSSGVVSGNVILSSFYSFSIIALFVFCLILLPFFRPFGAAHRYLEFVLPFLYILIGYCIIKNYIYLYVVAGILCIDFIWLVYRWEVFISYSDGNAYRELIAFIERYIKKDAVLLPIPMKMAKQLSLSLENCFVDALPLVVNVLDIAKICKKPHFPQNDLSAFRDIYKYDYIVYHKGSDNEYDFSEYEIVYQNREFIIFR